MARLVTIVLILSVIACVFTEPAAPARKRKHRPHYSATADKGSIGVGLVDGGRFGPGSFSIGHGGQSSGKGDGGHGGNQGTNSYGGQGGDSGHTSYGS